MAGTGRHAVHRTMVLVDVERFSAPGRTLHHQLDTRAGLYAVVAEALAAAGVSWEDCHHEDRGDGLFLLIPPEYPKAPLVEVLPEALVRAVRGHNNTSHDSARVRLRLAVHAGEVALDRQGATSTALTEAFRLLDTAPLKDALASSPGVLAMIVSRLVFDDVVRHCATLDPATFRPVQAVAKEFQDLAWIALPDHPYPADPTVLTPRPPDTPAPETASAGHVVSGPATGPVTHARYDGPGPRGVHIAGDVHGSGPGITIGAATGDHLTIGTPPPSAQQPHNPR
ncbi:hypothetical protein ADK67_14475 [Saccharothrix sp. NRRL B-16348]|uniref:hypothetical protein n=1 Tax=Saccharothrix sp. NRRL B-16348 TaxID=1415542 RepID=UPI0006AEAF6D|nr:hypothetical protein [Saccharothrix sp. NRRL B-16348]KOX27035.1 hypothetical protein ADK67_14475 [Saccharothrix sp. NRRL B-16348]